MAMLLCGLRGMEARFIDWETAIDLNNRKMTIAKSKTSAGLRVLPICDPLYEMLLQTPVQERKGPVCIGEKKMRLKKSGMERAWKTYCTRLTRLLNNEEPDQRGRRKESKADKFKKTVPAASTELVETALEEAAPAEAEPTEPPKTANRKVFSCTPHDLRHTYATALYDAGVDIKSAQYYLGHKDLKMTIDLYTHLSKERENSARSSLTDYLDKWLDKHIETENDNG